MQTGCKYAASVLGLHGLPRPVSAECASSGKYLNYWLRPVCPNRVTTVVY